MTALLFAVGRLPETQRNPHNRPKFHVRTFVRIDLSIGADGANSPHQKRASIKTARLSTLT